MSDESTCVGHEPCPACNSRDNLARYSDGHGYCFGCNHYEPGNGTAPTTERRKSVSMSLIKGEVRALAKRGITEETCKLWRYEVGEHNGRTVQLANYLDADRNVVAQKVRSADKKFLFTGDTKGAHLYGRWLWRDAGKKLVITEGEIDALTVSQLQGNKWPVVSVSKGAAGAAKCVAAEIEWLLQFDQVIFMFDDDEPGRAAAQECAELLPPGKAFIGTIEGFKDANEALQAGKGEKVIDAIWAAKAFRPDGLVLIDEIIDEAEKPIEVGLPWVFETLSKATYGRRYGEVYALGAGTGIGKTDFLSQQIAFDVETLGHHVGVIYLEQKPVETAKRIAGKIAGKRFHVPDGTWTAEEQRAALTKLRGRVTLYDSFGQTDWEVVQAKIRYMAVAQGIRLFYLDHLTALADTGNERECIEQMMKEIAGLANELRIVITFVSHLSTPEGKPHEEGGRVMIRHFKGSRAIGFWSYLMIGLERNQQAGDETARITVVRVLKDRYTGQATGLTFGLGYDAESGRLFECPIPSEDDEESGFKDETQTSGEF